MNIEQWFKKQDYTTGVLLYASLSKSSKNIVKRLQQGENPKNRATLKYELTKLRGKKPTKTVIKPVVNKSTPVVNTSVEAEVVTALAKENNKVTMAQLPDPYLRQRFVEKNAAFYKRWELKFQLNTLPGPSEEKALAIITEIMQLTTFIDAVWHEIDYFLEHKKLLPTANDYAALSFNEKCKSLQLLYQRRTKRRNTLNNWKQQIDSIEVKSAAFTKLKNKISNKTNELQQIEVDITTLKKLIDE